MISEPSVSAQVQALMLSPTMHRITNLAATSPVNIRRPHELKPALASSANQLIRAIDAGRIHCADHEDNAMLHALLMLAVDQVLDGRLKDHLQHAPLQ